MSKHASRTSDGPELDPRVRALLAAASAPDDTAGPLPGEDEALTAFRTSPQPTRRMTTLRPRVSTKAAVAAAITTGVLVAGVGAAAAGVLPGAAQQTVSSWLDSVGVSVPEGEGADEDGDLSGSSEEAPGDGADESGDPGGGSEKTSQDGAGENGDLPGRSEEAPGERGNGSGDQCGRPEETPGDRGNGNDGQRGRSEEAPGERGNRSGHQCGPSEEAPGQLDSENGNQCGRSEEAPGQLDSENGNQCGRSDGAPGQQDNENQPDASEEIPQGNENGDQGDGSQLP
jgi:hypothetical protein